MLSSLETKTVEQSSGILHDLSVVIVSYNTREVLRRCLETLEAESRQLSMEVLVVDNGSRDGSVDMVSPWLRGTAAPGGWVIIESAAGRTTRVRSVASAGFRFDTMVFCPSDVVGGLDGFGG